MTHDAAALKAQIDLRDVVASLWGDPERTAPRYHTYRARWRDDGQNASFTVYPDRFKDYGGRGRSGDVYEFLQHELDLSFTEALDWLAQHTGSGHTIPTRQRKATPARRPSTEPPAPQWQHAAQDALEQAQAYLWSDAPDAARVREYLRTVRGFTDETIKAAGYGYNPRWQPLDYQHPQRNYRVKLSPGIVEPWWCDGVLWALRVRRRVGNLAQWLNQPDDTLGRGDAPKYLNLAGSKQTGAMYNADTITPDGDVLVVEGGFDAQLAAQHLDDVAVVTFGSATNTPPARRIQQLKQARRVFLLLDADDAGQAAQSQLAAVLDGNAYSVTLPQGNDVTDFIVNHNGDLGAVLQEAAASGRVTPPTDTSADRGAWWANGVPDGVRSALLNYFRPTTAPVIELVNTAVRRGLLSAQAFTINQLLQRKRRTRLRHQRRVGSPGCE